MTLVKHDHPERQHTEREVLPRRLDFLDRFFDDWPEAFRRPVLLWPEKAADAMKVEEFTEAGMHVIRVEMPGIDPDKDVEITVLGNTLNVDAQRREDTETKERNYIRREHRYGSFHREMTVPKGTTEADVVATYKDGILEIKVPFPAEAPAAVHKIPVTKS